MSRESFSNSFIQYFVLLSDKVSDPKLKAECWCLRGEHGYTTLEIVILLQERGWLSAGDDEATLKRHCNTVDAWFSRIRHLAARTVMAASQAAFDEEDRPQGLVLSS